MIGHQRGASALVIILVLAVVIAVAVGAYLVVQGGDDEGQSAEDGKLIASGQGVTVEIEPAEGDTISGTVTISVTESPGGTKMAFFVLEGPGITDNTGPNLGIDDSDSDVRSIEFDTTEYENGSYSISGLAMESSDSNPLGMATAEVKIEN